MTKNKLYILTVLLAVMGCKKPITIAPVTTANSYLVVDGHINVGDSSLITLSRTVNIAGNARSNPELGAKVTIEGSDGSSYQLTASGNGNYRSAALSLTTDKKYRLKITTADGRQYTSDDVPVKNAPAVDAVGYQVKDNGLAITVDTHDAANTTRYYRWDYTDTYMVESVYKSLFIVVNGDTTALRTPQQQIYHCWLTDTSSTIILGSSAKLTEDKISNQQVAFVQPNAESLRIKFSILVKQYALTAEAFNYFDLLKRNSEQVGGIFDAQPSELTGNIHCTSNPAEPVIGFITAGAVTQKRLFIDNSALPSTWLPNLSYYDGCSLITVFYDFVVPGSAPPFQINKFMDFIYSHVEVPIDTVSKPQQGYTSARPYCADCTVRGTNKQPSFWK
jgi:hypothetical protein